MHQEALGLSRPANLRDQKIKTHVSQPPPSPLGVPSTKEKRSDYAEKNLPSYNNNKKYPCSNPPLVSIILC